MMDPSLGVENAEDWVEQISTAVQGLSWMSETDAPFDVQCWTEIAPDGLTPEAVLAYAQLPPDTLIEAISLDDFLAPAIQAQPWHFEEEVQNVEQFQALRTLLGQTLTQIQVYRCGTVEIEIYMVGQGPDSTWIALHTSAVET
jgi:gamma-glutamyl-gamma-aminobutyrate hydrolase PuuD